jgi:hypothetical protein
VDAVVLDSALQRRAPAAADVEQSSAVGTARAEMVIQLPQLGLFQTILGGIP